MNRSFNPTDLSGYNPYGCWNWFYDQNQHRGQGHPKLIYEMIYEIKSKYKINSNKVYVTVYQLAGHLPASLVLRIQMFLMGSQSFRVSG